MCGRFAQSQPLIQYARALDPEWTPPALEMQPTWNLAPSCRALVFHDGDAGHLAELLQWGFLPAWADPKTQKPNNARVETAATMSYFRKAWKTGRCLIPADGWYEWKVADKLKQPFQLSSTREDFDLPQNHFKNNMPKGLDIFCERSQLR